MKIDLLEASSEDVRIEIIPMIDVIFCILTFFILAAVGLTRQQAIDLDLPGASTGSPLPPQGLGSEAVRRQRLYVSIDAIGQVYIDQQPVTLELLSDVLQQHQQVSPQGLIVLYASRDARYEDVIQVLDLLRAVGGDRVALATLPDTQDADQETLSEEDLLDLDSFSGTDSPAPGDPGTLPDPFSPSPLPGQDQVPTATPTPQPTAVPE